jgi:hypothetical protein
MVKADDIFPSLQAPPWQAETSKAAWRGKLIVIELILNIAGFSLSNWVTYGFSFLPGGVSHDTPST